MIILDELLTEDQVGALSLLVKGIFERVKVADSPEGESIQYHLRVYMEGMLTALGHLSEVSEDRWQEAFDDLEAENSKPIKKYDYEDYR